MNIIVNEEALLRLLDTKTELPIDTIQSAINECKLKINMDTMRIIDNTMVIMNRKDETLIIENTDKSDGYYSTKMSGKVGKKLYLDMGYGWMRSLDKIIKNYLDVDLNKHQM